nr:serine hydrolase-like protein [Quercus suber]
MDRIQGLIHDVDLQDPRNLYIALTAPLLISSVLIPTLRIFNTIFDRKHFHNPTIFPAPRPSNPSRELTSAVPYPSNALPGARDVETPYGTIRAYEWGPATGRKVLLIHGISTPCIALASMAQHLVESQGCRVMLFDLFGRGYSDAPDPEIYKQDLSLFTSQILLVLTSSDLAWQRFTLLGYSLGGGIAAGFASYFPRMIASLILIAPAGVMRPWRISMLSKFVYGGLLPESLVHFLVGRRLGAGGVGKVAGVGTKGTSETSETAASTTPGGIVASEIPNSNVSDRPPPTATTTANGGLKLFADHPPIAITKATAWEIQTHRGFLPSFISSIKYAPITAPACDDRWRIIGRNQLDAATALNERKVLVLLGEKDGLIVPDEVEQDATQLFGSDQVIVERIAAGHDLAVASARECVDAMAEFWEGHEEKSQFGEGAGLI